MTVVEEGNLRFEFPDEWTVIKYDDSRFYRDRVQKCQSVKAADIVADSRGDIFIIEVKDFRRYRIGSKERLKNHKLATEVAEKVTDTIAGLYGAHRSFNPELGSLGARLFTAKPPRVKVILFLEEDRPPTPHRSFKQIRPNLRTAIAQRLAYLNVHCNVHNSEDFPPQYGWHVL
jgi:hypothetical protein